MKHVSYRKTVEVLEEYLTTELNQKQIAEKLGVSANTVSKALNNVHELKEQEYREMLETLRRRSMERTLRKEIVDNWGEGEWKNKEGRP